MTSLQSLENIGIFFKNIRDHPAQRTLVVLGVGRGGTTMVAGILEKLGVNMGTESGVAVEDPEIKAITKLFPREQWMQHLAPIVERRNAENDIWGFKLPRIATLGAELESLLRYPYFVFVFRDPVAVSVRNAVSIDLDFYYSMRKSLETYQTLARHLEQSTVPCIAISYEKALLRPKETVKCLAEALGLVASEVAIANAVNFVQPSPEEYVRTATSKTVT